MSCATASEIKGKTNASNHIKNTSQVMYKYLSKYLLLMGQARVCVTGECTSQARAFENFYENYSKKKLTKRFITKVKIGSKVFWHLNLGRNL